MSPRRPPPRPASRDWPGVMSLFPASRDCATAGGNVVSSSAHRRSRPWERTGCGKRRQTPDCAFSGLSPAQSSLLSQMHTAARWRGFPEASQPSSEAALSADIRADFPPKKRRPSARRPVFPLPAWEQPTQSKKITAKACFPSPRVKTAAPRAPPRPTSRMTHVFDAPHGNDALALFSPPAACPQAEQAAVSQAAWGSLTDSSGEKAAAQPAFSRSAQEHSA